MDAQQRVNRPTDNRPAGGLISVEEFADLVGPQYAGQRLGPKYVRREIQAGNIRAVRIGRRILILRSEVVDYPQRLYERQQRGQRGR
jgi:excisionase family DNA binding protein